MSNVYIFGLGLSYFADLTKQISPVVASSDVVYILASDVSTVSHVRKLNENVVDLFQFYEDGKPRIEIYDEIVRILLEGAKSHDRVSILVYGHPTLFVNPIPRFIEQARSEDFNVQIVPGASAEDWLFAALGLDPSSHGWLSFEATNFLLYLRRADPSAFLVLWQVGALGIFDYQFHDDVSNESVSLLKGHLEKFFSGDARCVAFEASPFLAIAHRVEEFVLRDILSVSFTKRTTMLIWPEVELVPDISMLKELRGL